MRESLYDYCVRSGREELLGQWDPEKNGELTPRDLTRSSHSEVWWRCGKGHEWKARVYTRTGGGSGCPYCAGRRPAPGENDLASQYPELAAEWHPTKNGGRRPEDVLAGSRKSVWWRCAKGHEWISAVAVRTRGSGCPICANRRLLAGENDLATTHPELAAEWHPTRNPRLTAADVVAGSFKKVWWRCGKGHEWQASVVSRAGNGTGCPVCAGKKVVPGVNDLASRFPRIAAQWLTEKNGGLTPREVSAYSNRRVWWSCALGHQWQAQIMARTGEGSGCPYCAGRKVLPGFNDLATLEPVLAAQWHPALNGALTPQMVSTGSHKKVWWQCSLGHVWKAVVYSRTDAKRCGCPVCAGKVRRRGPSPEAGRRSAGITQIREEAAK